MRDVIVRVWLGAAMAASMLAWPAVAAAQDATWRVPSGALAFYASDPTLFEQDDTGGATLSGALRLAAESGLVNDEFLPLIHALIAACQVGSAPHTVSVLDLDVGTDAGGAPVVEKLVVVLELHTDRGHNAAVEAIGTILRTGEASSDAFQERIDLDDDLSGVRFRREAWPAWQAVEWCSHDGGFVVAFGRGGLEQWSRGRDGNEPTLVARHRERMQDSRRAEGTADTGDRFLEVFVDLDRLRYAMPDLAMRGVMPRLLNALQLGDARTAMLHGHRAGRYLLLDSTMEVRRDPPGEVRRERLTLAAYPGELTLPEPEGSFVLVAEVEWGEGYEWVLDVATGVTDTASVEEFERKRRRYDRKFARRLSGLFENLKPYVVISDVPAAPISVPGAATVYVELLEPGAIETSDRILRELLAPFTRRGRNESLSDVHVETRGRGLAERIWYLRLDETGLARFPAWGWAGRWLVGSWSLDAVEQNRLALTAEPPADEP